MDQANVHPHPWLVHHGADPTPAVVIDCDSCRMHHTEACADCVVTFLCREPAAESVVVDLAELETLRLLSDAGLVPGLRHTGAAG